MRAELARAHADVETWRTRYTRLRNGLQQLVEADPIEPEEVSDISVGG